MKNDNVSLRAVKKLISETKKEISERYCEKIERIKNDRMLMRLESVTYVKMLEFSQKVSTGTCEHLLKEFEKL